MGGGVGDAQSPHCPSEARTAVAGFPTGLEPLGGLGPACSVTGVPGLQLVPGTQMVVQTGRVEGVLGAITEHNCGPGAF